MIVIGIVGWKNSGKTTLAAKLIAELTKRGRSVSTIKHTHHAVNLDQPGKDTYQHAQAGAEEVMLASASRWALMRELRDAEEPTLDDFLARLNPVDIVIIEGFKSWPHPKIEIHREVSGGALLCREDPNIIALASDTTHNDVALPQFGVDDIAALADFVDARL